MPPSTNRASQCFALNGNIFDPEVDGLDGVIEAYKNSLKNVNLYGPTNFAPIIELVNDMAEAAQVDQLNQKYNIFHKCVQDIREDSYFSHKCKKQLFILLVHFPKRALKNQFH